LRLQYGLYPMKNGKPDPDKRVTTLSYFLYKKQGDTLQATNDSLVEKGVTIAAKRGFSIVDNLKNLGVKVVEVSSSTSLFRMLEIGRVRGVALQDTEGDFHVKNMGPNHIEKLFPSLKTKHYYLMLSHQFVEKHPEIADKLWTKISEIRERITKDYGPQYDAFR